MKLAARCFCLPLDHGLTIWAWLECAAGLIALMLFTVLLVKVDVVFPDMDTSQIEQILQLGSTVIVIGLIVAILLLIGLTKGNRALLMPWMIITSIAAAISVVLLLPAIILSAIVLGPTALLFYRLYCTYSYYQTLEKMAKLGIQKNDNCELLT